jgi:hypothetical protein
MKKFQGGGGVPRQTTIGGQRHDLAYINPFEADLLRSYGGSGEPGPGGVPAYFSYSMSRNRDGSYSMPSSSQQRAQRAAAGAPSVSSSRSSSSAPTSSPRPPARPTTSTPSSRSSSTPSSPSGGPGGGGSGVGQTYVAPVSTPPKKESKFSQIRSTGGAYTVPKSDQQDEDYAERIANLQRQLDARDQKAKENEAKAKAAEDARIAEAAAEARRQRTIGIAQSVPDPMQGGLGGLTNLLGMIPGVPMLIDAAKGAAGDIQMSYYAGGPLRSREEQRRNLQEARNPDGSRMYSDFEIDEYFLITDETAERARQQAGVRPGGDDSTPYTLPAAADPCPEGYRMDSVTNMCVPADDVTGGTPPPVVPGFPDLTRPDPVAVPTVVSSSDYTQMPAKEILALTSGGVPPLLPGTGALPMPDFSRGFMPTTYGGMPTDIDPFR